MIPKTQPVGTFYQDCALHKGIGGIFENLRIEGRYWPEPLQVATE